MIAHEKLDVRTITMGISLLDCVDSDLAKMNEKIYNKITTYAKDLVSTGDAIGREFGVPIVNKRISVTPVSYTHLPGIPAGGGHPRDHGVAGIPCAA